MIAQINKAYIKARPQKVFSRIFSYLFFEGRPATTKGRWFNPVTFAALKFASRQGQIKGSDSPVFITGTGRSGSTILGVILSLHKDVGFLNEPKALWHTVIPNSDITGSYSDGDAFVSLYSDDFDPSLEQKVKSIYSTFLKFTGSKIVVDKFPEMIFRTEFLNSIFKSPKFIFLYRNPWDTIVSTAEWSRQNSSTNNGRVEDWWGVNKRKWKLIVEQVVPYDPYLGIYCNEIAAFDKQTDMAAVEWIVTMNKGLRAIDEQPHNFLPVAYEELVAGPENTIKRILDFLGLEMDKVVTTYAKSELRTRPVRSKVELHPLLKEPLSETAFKLGYGVQFPEISVTE